MKISNSKKELARIINENGGWRDGAKWSAQDKNGIGMYLGGKPYWDLSYKEWSANAEDGCCIFVINGCNTVSNYHQTILSREEYFHLYPAPDDGDSLSATLDSVTDENKHGHVDCKPTIEQLAADYRNRKDYADRKQEEADTAKADAEAKLAELVAAGKALGLVLSVADAEHELVITDWRDLRVGDEIECVSVCLGDNGEEMFEDYKRHHGKVCRVIGFEDDGINHINTDIDGGLYIQDFKFIRRP